MAAPANHIVKRCVGKSFSRWCSAQFGLQVIDHQPSEAGHRHDGHEHRPSRRSVTVASQMYGDVHHDERVERPPVMSSRPVSSAASDSQANPSKRTWTASTAM